MSDAWSRDRLLGRIMGIALKYVWARPDQPCSVDNPYTGQFMATTVCVTPKCYVYLSDLGQTQTEFLTSG